MTNWRPTGSRSGAEIGPWRPGDEDSICRLFAATFGRDKSVERWRWQFLGQGGEPQVMLARDEQGEVIAHFGGVARRVQVDGAAHVFTVAVDSMVARTRRIGLQRRGLFTEVVERWVRHFCGPGRIAVGFGLPNHEAYRLGRRRLGYAPLGEMIAQVLALQDAGESRPSLPASSQAEPDHDELWERCRARLPVSAVRDRAFLTWRWASCPGGDFRFLSARRNERLQAVAVYSPAYTEPDCASLADLLWDGEDPAALAACVGHAAALARESGRRYLVALLPETAPETAVLQTLGFRAAPTGHPFVARSFDPDLSLAWLARRWYFTFADFDLV